MQLTKDFSSKLATAVAPTRVHPSVARTTDLPSVVYRSRGGIRDVFYSGSYGLRTTRYQVDVFTKTYAEAADLKDSIVSAFHGFTGAMGASTVSKSTVDNTLENFSDNGEKVYHTIIDINILD